MDQMPLGKEGSNPLGDIEGISAPRVFFPWIFFGFFFQISSFLWGCLIKILCSSTCKVFLTWRMRLLEKVSCCWSHPLLAGVSDVALFLCLLENKFNFGQKHRSEFCLPRAFQKASNNVKPLGYLSKYQRNNCWQFPDSLQQASHEVFQ